MALYKEIEKRYNVSRKAYANNYNKTHSRKATNMGRRKQGRRNNGLGGIVLRGNTYYARYTDALGVRREVSTHTSNMDEAYRVLATYTTPIRQSKSIEEMVLRHRQEAEALEHRKDIKKIGRVKLDDLIEKFINHRDLADATNQTKNIYKAQLKNLVATIKAKYPTVKSIDEVTYDIVDDVMGEIIKIYTPTTYNLAISTYRRCWNLFSRSNPFLKITKRHEDKSRHRILIEEDDVRRIFACCRDDEERAIWGVGVYTGLRCGDVCHLNYGALSKDLTSIKWTPMKTKRHMPHPLTIPIHPILRNLLLKVLDLNKIGKDEEKDTPLWATYKRRYDGNYISEYFGRTLKKAELPTSHIDENGHRQVDTGFHITRLVFVTFADGHLSPMLVSKIVGHSSLKMTEHYFQEHYETLMKGISQMPNLTCAKGEVEQPRAMSEVEVVMNILNELKDEDESALDCLKRIVSIVPKFKKAS